MKHHYVEQEIAPQVEGGVDYSARGIVLVRAPAGKLVWRSGGKCWAGIGMEPNYVGSQLHTIRKGHTLEPELSRGGRLSRGRLTEHIGAIRERLGLPWLKAEQIDPKRTLVVEQE